MKPAFRVLNMADTPFLQEEFKLMHGVAEVTHLAADQQRLAACISEYDAYFCSLHT